MAFQPGESGNPNGTPKSKPFLAALNRAIAQDDSKKLRAAAEKLLELAEAGEPWAIKELADRTDGKAHQSVAMENPDGTSLFSEIVRVIREK